MSGRYTRPRRTKMYDCNFVAGQRYYQPVLNEVDRKYAGRSGEGGGLNTLRDALSDAEATLGSRSRASATPDPDARERRPLSALLDDAEGDSSPFARGSARRKLAAALDEADAADDEFFSSRRVRDSRARIAALEDEISASSSLRSRRQNRSVDEFADKVLDTVGLKNSDIGKARQFLEEDSFFKRRSKVSNAEDEDIGSSKSLMKWSKLADVEEGESAAELAAKNRARKSRARIADLDAEMEEMESRAAARQRRSANVRKLLAETAELGGEDAESSSTTTRSALRVKKISATATAEKKTVTF